MKYRGQDGGGGGLDWASDSTQTVRDSTWQLEKPTTDWDNDRRYNPAHPTRAGRGYSGSPQRLEMQPSTSRDNTRQQISLRGGWGRAGDSTRRLDTALERNDERNGITIDGL